MTGLSGMNSTLVGVAITTTGANSAGNNGNLVIASVASPTEAVIINPAGVAPDTNNGSINWSIADTNTLVFVNGPNAGIVATATAVTPTTITVSTPYPFLDPVGSDYYIVEPTGDLLQAINGELYVLNDTTAAIAVPPAIAPAIDSELASIDTAIQSFGQTQISSPTGIATSAIVLTDTGVNYSTVQPPITTNSLLYVTSGPNQGLYQIASVTDTTITISPSTPFPIAFPSVGALSPYIVLAPWPFLSSQEFAFATGFQQNTLAFYNATLAWSNNVTALGAVTRKPGVVARQASVLTYIATLEGLLGSNDNLYNTRYLWIQQRTDKTIGLLLQQVQASAQRLVNTQNLVAAQQKLLIINQLLKLI
jgi:hypothetical protein